MTLRSKLIRLAHQNPDLRPHLLPLLKQAAGEVNVPGLHILGNAVVSGKGKVLMRAQALGNAQVTGESKVFGRAQVSGNAKLTGKARVYDNAQVADNAHVGGDAHVHGKAKVFGTSEVYGSTSISGTAGILGGKWDGSEGPITSGQWKAPGVPA
jgi:hypothetical protein